MRIEDEHDLRERLDAAFGAISLQPAPIDDAIRGGRVIRGRRRLALAVGVGVVAATVAVAVPTLAHQTAAPAPASPGRQHYTVTVQAPGRDSTPGVIALGTINGQRWWIIADRPGADFTHPGQQDIVIQGPAVGAPDGSDQYVPPLGTAGSPGPVSFTGITTGAAQVQVGAVQADVSYVTVRLGNGALLVLHPVTAYGVRAVAFAAPVRAGITEVAAYSRHGEIGFAVPFNWPAGGAWVISWLRPGQAMAPRVSDVIGSGTAHGKAWSATAYIGPWGTCIGLDGGAAPGGGCFPSGPAVTGVLTLNQGRTPEIAGGVAPATATRVVVTQPDGTKVQVRLVTVGGQKVFAFAVRPGGKPLRCVAYDSAWKVVASSTAAPGG
jgi:hypothetical protein